MTPKRLAANNDITSSGSSSEGKPDTSGDEATIALVDGRSPLERFRTAPKKPLSVTDLISPAWCELQYWYSLTRHGKKLRTAAMKAGTVVHKALEDQVHRTVKIEVKTREDAWGIRIWNVIQGLKMLRNTGITRELEIWGVIDGQVVNGVIDQLSYDPPDDGLDAGSQGGTGGAAGARDRLPASQTSLDDYLKFSDVENGVSGSSNSQTNSSRKIYITDVKTRGVKSLPSGASFRPTIMQLMIYHRLLSDLASNQVDPTILFKRYQLDPSTPFSDSFIAEIANLNEHTFYDAPTHQTATVPDPSQSDSLALLLEHNSLTRLWSLMARSFATTFPASRASIADILKVEYRSPTDASAAAAVQAIRTFRYDHDKVQAYLDDEMSWWRGERGAVGVPVEEAYKCRFCEFADSCEWRTGKVDEALRSHRSRSGRCAR